MRRRWWTWTTLLGSLVLAGCSASPNPVSTTFGTVRGVLEETGVPSRLLPGAVTLTSGGRQYTVAVPRDGRFSLRVPTGTYSAEGGSPDVRVRNATHAEAR